MTENEFYTDYLHGRKDFRNEDLRGIDFFTPIFRKTHTEFLRNKISYLIYTNNKNIYSPINGVNLNNYDFRGASLLDTELVRAIFSNCLLSDVDARFASFSGVDLSSVDFTGADLRFSSFFGINITSSKFCNANLDHSTFKFSRIENTRFDSSSAIAINIFRSTMINNDLINCNFSNANSKISYFITCMFRNTDFSNSLLSDVFISKTSAKSCQFENINMYHVRFKNYESENSIYSSSHFQNVVISESSFDADSFEGSMFINSGIINCKNKCNDFSKACFQSVNLNKSKFIMPRFGDTSFNNVDLSYFIHAKAIHYKASSIDHKSIAITVMNKKTHSLDLNAYTDLQDFVESCGINSIVAIYLIDSIRALNKNQLREVMSSTFISYGGPDEYMAKKINDDLRAHDVTTFFFPLDATFGEKLHSTMHRINDYDRVILLCSRHSLDRSGLLYELEKTLEREAREGGRSYLIPIALDNYVFKEWKPAREYLRVEILNRVVADFTDMNNYSSQFQRLLRSLLKLRI